MLVQCAYAIYFFRRIFSLPTPVEKNKTAATPVSIIICAKNEAQNLRENLPSILSQIYMNEAGKSMYEVIVVNDGSTDDTAAVLQQLEQQYDNLWDVVVSQGEPKAHPGKKNALSHGITYSSHKWFLFTDADCVPSGNYWLQNMVAPLEKGKKIVTGYGKYRHAAGLLNAWTRWETMHTFLQYSTYALAGKPYMAVGRNMACTKDVFLKAQASEVWNNLPSGDDDLLMSIAATARNTAVVYNREAYTSTASKQTWKAWLQQKQRHMSTGKYYKSDIKNLLGLYGLSHAIMWLLFFALLAMGDWRLLLMLMAIRCAVYWPIMAVTSCKLGEKLLFSLPFFDLGYMLYNFVLAPYIIFKNKKQWT